MGWWLDAEETQWRRESNETQTCQHCSRGLTPQRHRIHEEACARKKRIAEINRQQRQLEADILSRAISEARRKDLTNISEHWQSSGM